MKKKSPWSLLNICLCYYFYYEIFLVNFLTFNEYIENNEIRYNIIMIKICYNLLQ